MKLAIIANPVAGGGRPVKRLQSYIERWPHEDWIVDLHLTYGPEHAGQIVRELLDAPPDLLAVCGGDGTLHEVVSRAPEPPFPVAVLPAGTANVLARQLGLPLDPILSMEIALKRNVRRFDLGHLEARTRHYFLLMAGVGFDAYVAAHVRPTMKRKFGQVAYYLSTLSAMIRYSFPSFRVVMKDETVEASYCLISNSAGYGGGLALTPNADMSDGLLDLFLIQRSSRWLHIKCLLSAWLGRPPAFTSIRRHRASEVSVEGPRGLWVHSDGELVGTLPIKVRAVPRSYPLVVPPLES